MKYKQTFKEALKQVREDGHTDVASAVRQCKTTMEDASQMLSKLQGMNPEDSLPSWWMNKIAIAANSMNKLRDYLLVPSTNEAKEESKENEPESEVQILRNKIQKLELALQQAAVTLKTTVPNAETGEVPLRTGLASAILDKNSPKPKVHSLDKKKLKMSLGKSKIEINPDVEMGLFSGGKKVPDGKLY